MSSREWDSGSYHRLSDQQLDWGRKVLARVRVRGDETLLDAGCGTGRVTAGLLALLPRGRVVAVDLSESMLRTARQNLAGQERVTFVCADLQRLPFHERFSGIFSTATFHWAKDHPLLFRSLFGALKPGGWLVAQCGGGPNLARLRQRVGVLVKSPKYAPYFIGWRDPWEFASPEITAERMKNAGFVDVETWLESAGFALPDADTFKQYMATVTLHRHIERIPDELRQDFLDEIARQSSADPEFSLDYWRLNINARRPE